MKYFLLIIIFLVIQSNTKAVEPTAFVPPLPGNLDAYTDNEEIFFAKVMDYYIPALLLDNQLRLLGQTPQIKVIPKFTYEMVNNLDPKYIKQYYKIATDLFNQVKNTELNIVDQNLYKCEKEKSELQKQVIKLSLDTIASTQNKELYEMLIKNFDSTIIQHKEFEKLLLEKIDKLNSELYNDKINNINGNSNLQIFSIKVSNELEQFFYSLDNIQTYLSPGIDCNITLIKLSPQANFISLWGKYNYIANLVTTSQNNRADFNNWKFSSDLLSLGMNFEFSLSQIINTNNLNWIFDLGIGYFKQYTKVVNTNLPDNEFSGYKIKMETSFYKFSQVFPIGLVFGVDFNKYSDNLFFPVGPSAVDLGKIWAPSVYAGIRFNLINIY
jgi:hypothetical protein